VFVTISFNHSESCINVGPRPEYKIFEKFIEIWVGLLDKLLNSQFILFHNVYYDNVGKTLSSRQCIDFCHIVGDFSAKQ